MMGAAGETCACAKDDLSKPIKRMIQGGQIHLLPPCAKAYTHILAGQKLSPTHTYLPAKAATSLPFRWPNLTESRLGLQLPPIELFFAYSAPVATSVFNCAVASFNRFLS